MYELNYVLYQWIYAIDHTKTKSWQHTLLSLGLTQKKDQGIQKRLNAWCTLRRSIIEQFLDRLSKKGFIRHSLSTKSA